MELVFKESGRRTPRCELPFILFIIVVLLRFLFIHFFFGTIGLRNSLESATGRIGMIFDIQVIIVMAYSRFTPVDVIVDRSTIVIVFIIIIFLLLLNLGWTILTIIDEFLISRREILNYLPFLIVVNHIMCGL